MSKKLIIITATPTTTSAAADFDEITNVSMHDIDYIREINHLADSSFDEGKVFGFVPSDELQEQLFRILKPNSKLAVQGGLVDRAAGQALANDLKIQGFVDVMAAKDTDSGERFVVAKKPSWEIGSAAPLKVLPPVAQATWKMGSDDLNEDDLVDENELLDDGIMALKPKVDCGDEIPEGGKKRACKNCSCGLAEIEAEEEAKIAAGVAVEDRAASSSACGNCYKGDAFRCGSCPFLGKPAFEPGNEKVVLSLASDDI